MSKKKLDPEVRISDTPLEETVAEVQVVAEKIVPVIEPIQPNIVLEPNVVLGRGNVLLVKVDAQGNEIGMPFQISAKQAEKSYLHTGQYKLKKSPTQ